MVSFNLITILPIFILTMLSVAETNGQQKNQVLIGTWERLEEESELPQIEIGGECSKPIEVLLMFKEDRTIKVKQGSQIYESEYKLTTKELILGNRKYKLLKLDSDSLIMKEISQWESLASTYRYFKTSKRIK